MDDVLGFFPSTPFLSPSSSSSSSYIIGGRESGEDDSTTFGAMVGRVVRVIVTCISAAVGSFIGAVTGGLIGLATESGLFRGAGIGAISGAVFTIEVVDSSLALWHSHESGIWSLLYLLDILSSLLSGRLVREKVGPAVQSAVQSQITAVNSPFMEALDIFDTGSTKGMPRESVDKLPRISITDKNNVDESGERIGCVVCLQDFQIGETVRRLPHCEHMFHLPCIDGWLLKHGSCPLCRRDF